MSKRTALLVLAAVLLLLRADDALALATNPPHIAQFPTAEQVRAKINKGADAMDTAARQMGAFWQLQQIVQELAGPRYYRNQLTPDENRIIGQYRLGYSTAAKPFAEIGSSPSHPDKQKWFNLHSRYELDAGYRDELLKQFFKQEFRDQYAAAVAEARAKDATRDNILLAAPQRQQPQPAGYESLTSNLLPYLCIGFPVMLGFVLLFLKMAARSRTRSGLGREVSRWKEAADRERQQWLAGLGNTPDERVASINQIFDRRDRTLSTVGWAELSKGVNGGYIGCRISRNLAAMENREREPLRAVELLAATGWDEAWCAWKKFGLIWGDGKASIEEIQYSGLGEQEGVKDAHGAVAWFAAQFRLTVDSVINDVLKTVEGLNQQAAQHRVDSPVLRQINRQFKGGGAWLTAGDLPGTIFADAGPYSVRLGLLEDSNRVLTYDLARRGGEGSLITIAPPGSGKTACFVLPNLLTWPASAVVLDVKGEIYAATSRWRADNVGPVFKFNPMDPSDSHSYNPLVFVRSDPDFLWEDARFLADMMIVPSASKDPFWENKARDVLQAAIAYVCLERDVEGRPMSKVIDIIHGVGWGEFVTYARGRVDIPSMSRAAHSLAAMEPKQRESVLQTAQASMSAWSGARIERATRKSDWSPLDLRAKTGTTIYICVKPNEIDSLLSVLRVFIAQHIETLIAQKPGGEPAPVLFMLDELPRLKNMPPVEKALATGRGYGIRLWMFAQDYGQLKEAYPDAEGLLTNCTVQTFMNVPLNSELAQKLSDMLGYRESALDNSRVKLVEPLELAGPKFRDLVLVLGTGTPPAKVRKAFAFQDPALRARMPAGSL